MDSKFLKRKIARYILDYGYVDGVLFGSLLVSFLHDNHYISDDTYFEVLDFFENLLSDL